MLYHVEIQMLGAIILTAMLVCGITMWVRRRRAEREQGQGYDLAAREGTWPDGHRQQDPTDKKR